MPLFLSRRAYDASTKRFTKNPASTTRYVAISDPPAGGGARSHQLIGQDDWLRQVQADGGDRDVLIFVHGYNTSQGDMLDRLALIRDGLRSNGYDGALVGFDWPSDGDLRSYGADRTDARRVAPHLVGDGILPLLELDPRPRVHVLAHSMGGFVVMRALCDFADDQSSENWSVDQVMFASADVDARALGQGALGGVVMRHRSARFTNYFSSRDQVLEFSHRVIHPKADRAGRVGLPDRDLPEQVDVYCNEQYDRDVPIGDRTPDGSHIWWFENDGFYADLALTLDGRDAGAMPTRRRTDTGRQALLT
ncbi:MAG: alpha/beta fold hydrolase [Marinibacterium sp.]|nr:alpha/beta fold hydrolase [Marinibacterium sp.]